MAFDARKSIFGADREAAIQALVESARIDPIGTSFEGKGNLTRTELGECIGKTAAMYHRAPW